MRHSPCMEEKLTVFLLCTCLSSYLERHRSRWQLESNMAAAPIRKKQLGRSMWMSFPLYQE